MLYVIIAIDRPGRLERRRQNREAHLNHIASAQSRICTAGPFLTEDGTPCGSMFVIEADNLEDAEAFVSTDPYSAAGVFESVTVRPWRVTIGTGLKAKVLE